MFIQNHCTVLITLASNESPNKTSYLLKVIFCLLLIICSVFYLKFRKALCGEKSKSSDLTDLQVYSQQWCVTNKQRRYLGCSKISLQSDLNIRAAIQQGSSTQRDHRYELNKCDHRYELNKCTKSSE